MARQPSVGWACGWLVSAVFWSWVENMRWFPWPFRFWNEKWNARAHSVRAHLRHFQSQRSYRAHALSSVAKSSLSQLDMSQDSHDRFSKLRGRLKGLSLSYTSVLVTTPSNGDASVKCKSLPEWRHTYFGLPRRDGFSVWVAAFRAISQDSHDRFSKLNGQMKGLSLSCTSVPVTTPTNGACVHQMQIIARVTSYILWRWGLVTCGPCPNLDLSATGIRACTTGGWTSCHLQNWRPTSTVKLQISVRDWFS